MNGSAFKLGTFARPNGGPFAAIVLGESVIDLSKAHAAYGASRRANALSATDSILGLLENWEANFAALQEIVAFLEKEGLRPEAADLASLRALPPVIRPGKMFYAAQNFQEHVDEMIRAGMTPAAGPKFTGEKATTRPYLFLKAPSCLAGAHDEIAIPLGMKKIDWEAEIALAIGKKGKRIKAEHALDHVAGFMTTNDVSCRDLQIRPDRPGLRSDWLGGKSHDNFAPMGPFLVPRAFVPNHMNLFIRLTVNGEVKQDGNTSQFIFTPEEQIEYASHILSIETGDIFSCGTCGGVGQGTNTFLASGDVMETEIESLGTMRNRLVAETG
ncbi:MAG: 2,4-didehydro-3-deoxy-L-rhamnonate hydrolase [Alphaproteobacteria bacterium]|jgi:2-keto-4-pentenoate hydratase/2-oxohepta-3-ene-1,7-dioic acid hydratase in catechol pathway|nr:2,4-didehydro-3-deoxy-L-rhamnonate hydrolase [Alphaproteobacteria bacterium]